MGENTDEVFVLKQGQCDSCRSQLQADIIPKTDISFLTFSHKNGIILSLFIEHALPNCREALNRTNVEFIERIFKCLENWKLYHLQ